MGFQILNIIGTEFRVDDTQGKAGADRMAGAFENVRQRAHGAMRSIIGMVGAAAGVYAIQRAFVGMVGQTAAMEDSVRSMTAFLSASFDYPGQNQYLAAQREAKSLIDGIAKDAARLPGEFADFVSVMQSAAGPVFALGKGGDDLRRLVGEAAVAASIFGIETRQTGFDIQRMLQGQAGLESSLWRNLTGMNLLKMSAQEFNKLAPEERYNQLRVALGALVSDADLLAAVSASWNTQWSTLKDNVFGVQGFLGQIGARVLPVMTAQVSRLNDWFTSHPDKLRRAADAITGSLIPALNSAGRLTLYMLENAREIRTTLIGVAGLYATISLASTLGGGSAMRGFETAAGLATRRVANPVVMGSTNAIVGAGMAQGLGLSTWIAKMGPIIPIIVAGLKILTPIVLGIAGVMMVLHQNTLGFGESFRIAGTYLMSSFGELARALVGAGAPVAHLLGLIIVPTLSALAYSLGAVIKVIVSMANAVGSVVSFLTRLASELILGNFRGSMSAASQAARDFRFEDLAQKWSSSGAEKSFGFNLASGSVGVPKNQTNIYGDINIEQKFDRNVTPDRVAFSVLDVLNRQVNRMAREPNPT